ncbi:hypothetical protein D915_008223 [Fasciola hepatica]|uniref:Uncharacterized protein n=1 Tax=Fasciola hepatica TaxID=6192 RepID=A0A4E0R422_FASHE|nr:hypothetical protein D915_008223 [Fasciola hepatica]
MIPRKAFTRLVSYVQKLNGSARNRLISSCEQIISKIQVGEQDIEVKPGTIDSNEPEASQQDPEVATSRANILLVALNKEQSLA